MATDKIVMEKTIQYLEPDKILLHILPHKISSHRYKKFIEKCKLNRIPVIEKYQSKVTHVVSELDYIDDVVNRLGLSCSEETGLFGETLFLNTQYLSECLKIGTVVKPNDTHVLHFKKREGNILESAVDTGISDWACMRSTPLRHHNEALTDAIEVLEKHADLNGDELNYSRSLAFRRCISVLKAYPSRVKRMSEIKRLPHVGEHCQKVIKEILESGKSEEIIQISGSELFRKMKLFTSIFGVGVSSARKWIDHGLSEISEVSTHPFTANIQDERVVYGVAYHADLCLPVQRCEADWVLQLVKEEVRHLLPDATVTLTGGFRRGKEVGHDIDILISHPEEGQEIGLLPRLLQRLNAKGLVLYGKYDKRSDTVDRLKHTPRGKYLKSSHDEFEKWYGILRLDKNIMDTRETVSEDACCQAVNTESQGDLNSQERAYTELKPRQSTSTSVQDMASGGLCECEDRSGSGKRPEEGMEECTNRGEPVEKRRRQERMQNTG